MGQIFNYMLIKYIAAVQIEIDKLEGELKTVQAEMNKYLKELGATK
jgi:hypothetical protein